MAKKNWGFDTRDMNPKVRPQDDLYQHAGGGWLKRNPIPATESSWGSFRMLRQKVDYQIRTLFAEVAKDKKAKTGSAAQLIRDFYTSGVDLKRRSTLGLKPIAPWRDAIADLKKREQIVPLTAKLHRIGVGVLWSGLIDQDIKASEKYLLYIGQGGIGMPDRDYYLNNDSESTRVREAYRTHLVAMFKLLGYSPKVADAKRDIVMKIETALAKASMAKEDTRDVDKTYHKKTHKELARLTPGIDWERYLKLSGAAKPKELVVMQPEFFKVLEKLLTAIPLEDWKAYLEWHLFDSFAPFLTPRIVTQNFTFYGTVLSGTKKMRPLWRRILNVVNGSLGELVGQLYIEKYFPPEAKKKVSVLVDDLFTAYKTRIQNLDWMSAATKKKALVKLSLMGRKLAYPDKWKSYGGLVINPSDYVGNVVRSHEFEYNREMRKLRSPINRKEWFMAPQMVNAYCHFGLNEIVFPAAILQPPFFNIDADDAINYGSIGTVIGHEITHGFDDQGSKFDGKGNRKTWWTPKDRKSFETKAKKVVAQFNAYKVAPDVPVNGSLTQGENIADLGGASIAFDAYMLHLEKTGEKNIDGFTPEQRFFLGFTLFEREQGRPEYLKTVVMTDPHSPPMFRVNGPASNLPEFYEAFDVKKGDKLYRDPKQRAKIW